MLILNLSAGWRRLPGLPRRIFLSLLLAVVVLPGFSTSITWANDTGADAFIDRISQQVLSAIKTDPAIQAGDQTRINALVDEFIMPHVDFRRTTALAVGLNWRSATESQRKALTHEFKQMLMRTYSGALSQVRNEQVRVLPLRARPDATDVIVRSQIIGRGEPIELGYRMEKSGDRWQIYDLNVLGVWFVQTYRSQFKPIITEQGIDGLIQTLAEKNAQS